MRAFAVEILEPRLINIEFQVDEDISDVHLDMQQRKNLYLIFKEAVNNIVKYADCKNVVIDIRREGSKTFFMMIKDDGKGFVNTGASSDGKGLSGNGILNMKKRAEELKGEMTIHSTLGTGVVLDLKFVI